MIATIIHLCAYAGTYLRLKLDLNIIEKLIRLQMNMCLCGTTCAQNCRYPIRLCRSFRLQLLHFSQSISVSRRYESFSRGSLASIDAESSSNLRNSRQVSGRTVFLGWNDRPRSFAVSSIQSIAALAACAVTDRLNMGKKSSR